MLCRGNSSGVRSTSRMLKDRRPALTCDDAAASILLTSRGHTLRIESLTPRTVDVRLPHGENRIRELHWLDQSNDIKHRSPSWPDPISLSYRRAISRRANAFS